MRNSEKNFHWGKLSIHGYSDGSDGNPSGNRYVWKGWSLRIGWHQVALWRNHKPIIDWLTPWSDCKYTFRKGLYIGRHPLIRYGR